MTMIPYDYLRKLLTWVISRTPEKALENNKLLRKIESLSEYSFPHDRIFLNRYPGPQKKKTKSMPELYGYLERSLVHKDVSHFPYMSDWLETHPRKTADNQSPSRGLYPLYRKSPSSHTLTKWILMIVSLWTIEPPNLGWFIRPLNENKTTP